MMEWKGLLALATLEFSRILQLDLSDYSMGGCSQASHPVIIHHSLILSPQA